MKTNLFSSFAFLLILLLTFNLQAQVKIGLRAGVNFASLAGFSELGDNINKESFPRLSIMIPVEIPLAHKWVLQPEVGFTQRGFKVEGKAANYSEMASFQLDYLDLNLLAKYMLSGQSIKWGLMAGPSFNYGVRAKSISETNQNGQSQKEEETHTFGKDGLRKIDFGLQFGTFVQTPMAGGEFIVDARYHVGYLNISTVNESPVLSNRGLQFSVGFLRSLNK